MNDAEYRRLCAQPHVMRRTDIRATLTRLAEPRPELATRLHDLLASPPVPKPRGHDAGPDTDYLMIDLAQDEIEEIVDALGELETALALDEHTDEARAAGTLLDRWNAAESANPDAA